MGKACGETGAKTETAAETGVFGYSLGRRFGKKYVLMVAVPLCVFIISFSISLYCVYTNSVLYQQEAYLNSLEQIWQTPVSQVKAVRSAMDSMTEIKWYLYDNRYTQRERLSVYNRSLSTFFNNLMIANDHLKSIHIYSKNQDIFRVGPFLTMDELPLSGDELEALEQKLPLEFCWRILPAASVEEKPRISAYYKYYFDHYVVFQGYVEIGLENDFLDEYVKLVKKNIYNEANVYLFQEDDLIYRAAAFEVKEDSLTRLLAEPEKSGVSGGYYYFHIELPEYGVQLLILLPYAKGLTETLAWWVLGSVIVVTALYWLSLRFFREVTILSKRIGKFSAFMQEYDRQELAPYQEEEGLAAEQADEFSALVESFNLMVGRIDTLDRKVLNLELRNQEARLAAMQAQIHPHFIYGTLETIRMLALQNDDDEVEEIVCSFSRLMRYSLNSPSHRSTLSKELEINQYYMDIQSLRHNGRIVYGKETDGGLPDLYCPPFIIQPLLENALVHGVSGTLESRRICLKTYGDGGDYVIRVADDGNMLTEERRLLVNQVLSRETEAGALRSEESGFALINVADRLRLFYHGHASLSLLKSGEWTVSEIRIQGGEWENAICSEC